MPSANILRTHDGSDTTDTVLPNKVIIKISRLHTQDEQPILAAK